MSVYLTQYSTVLHLEFADDSDFAHPVADAPILNIEQVHGNIIKGLLNALSAFIEHLHFLVAQGHVVEENEQLQLVSATQSEVNDVDDPIGFLEQVQTFVVLLLLDELDGRVIEFPQHNRNLVLRHSQFFVVVLAEAVTFQLVGRGVLLVFHVVLARGVAHCPCIASQGAFL